MYNNRLHKTVKISVTNFCLLRFYGFSLLILCLFVSNQYIYTAPRRSGSNMRPVMGEDSNIMRNRGRCKTATEDSLASLIT